MTTPNTHEQRLRSARMCVDVTACAARLRRERGRHFDERAAGPRELVAQHVVEDGPACVADATRAAALHHACDVQFLDDDDAVTLGKSRGLNVQMVSALAPNLTVHASDAELGFDLIAGTFLLAGYGALSASKSLERGLEMLRVVDEVTIGRGAEVHDAAIDRDDGFDARIRIWDLDLADDRSEPLVAVANERAGLACAFEWSMDDDAHRSEFGEVERAACRVTLVNIETPNPWMRLAEVDDVLALAFPVRRIGDLREAALPCAGEFDEELSADISRDGGEPGQFGAQRGQLIDLIECGRIATLAFRLAIVCDQPLLEREVPQEAQRVTPRVDVRRDLLGARVGAQAERLVDQHDVMYSLVCAKYKGVSSGETCRPRPECAFGLRAKVSPQGHHCKGVCVALGCLHERVQGLRMRDKGAWIRRRSCPSSDRVSAEGCAVDAGQFAQGSLSEAASCRCIARGAREVVGDALLEPELLCRLLWRRTVKDRAEVRGATTRSGFIPALNGGVSALEI
jgi:hypothetical protein